MEGKNESPKEGSPRSGLTSRNQSPRSVRFVHEIIAHALEYLKKNCPEESPEILSTPRTFKAENFSMDMWEKQILPGYLHFDSKRLTRMICDHVTQRIAEGVDVNHTHHTLCFELIMWVITKLSKLEDKKHDPEASEVSRNLIENRTKFLNTLVADDRIFSTNKEADIALKKLFSNISTILTVEIYKLFLSSHRSPRSPRRSRAGTAPPVPLENSNRGLALFCEQLSTVTTCSKAILENGIGLLYYLPSICQDLPVPEIQNLCQGNAEFQPFFNTRWGRLFKTLAQTPELNRLFNDSSAPDPEDKEKTPRKIEQTNPFISPQKELQIPSAAINHSSTNDHVAIDKYFQTNGGIHSRLLKRKDILTLFVKMMALLFETSKLLLACHETIALAKREEDLITCKETNDLIQRLMTTLKSLCESLESTLTEIREAVLYETNELPDREHRSDEDKLWRTNLENIQGYLISLDTTIQACADATKPVNDTLQITCSAKDEDDKKRKFQSYIEPLATLIHQTQFIRLYLDASAEEKIKLTPANKKESPRANAAIVSPTPTRERSVSEAGTEKAANKVTSSNDGNTHSSSTGNKQPSPRRVMELKGTNDVNNSPLPEGSDVKKQEKPKPRRWNSMKMQKIPPEEERGSDPHKISVDANKNSETTSADKKKGPLRRWDSLKMQKIPPQEERGSDPHKISVDANKNSETTSADKKKTSLLEWKPIRTIKKALTSEEGRARTESAAQDNATLETSEKHNETVSAVSWPEPGKVLLPPAATNPSTPTITPEPPLAADKDTLSNTPPESSPPQQKSEEQPDSSTPTPTSSAEHPELPIDSAATPASSLTVTKGSDGKTPAPALPPKPTIKLQPRKKQEKQTKAPENRTEAAKAPRLKVLERAKAWQVNPGSQPIPATQGNDSATTSDNPKVTDSTPEEPTVTTPKAPKNTAKAPKKSSAADKAPPKIAPTTNTLHSAIKAVPAPTSSTTPPMPVELLASDTGELTPQTTLDEQEAGIFGIADKKERRETQMIDLALIDKLTGDLVAPMSPKLTEPVAAATPVSTQPSTATPAPAQSSTATPASTQLSTATHGKTFSRASDKNGFFVNSDPEFLGRGPRRASRSGPDHSDRGSPRRSSYTTLPETLSRDSGSQGEISPRRTNALARIERSKATRAVTTLKYNKAAQGTLEDLENQGGTDFKSAGSATRSLSITPRVHTPLSEQVDEWWKEESKEIVNEDNILEHIKRKLKESPLRLHLQDKNLNAACVYILCEYLRSDYELCWLTSAIEKDPSKAQPGKIYIEKSEKYSVLDPEGVLQKGNFKFKHELETKFFDTLVDIKAKNALKQTELDESSNLHTKTNLNNATLKKWILASISNNQHLRPPIKLETLNLSGNPKLFDTSSIKKNSAPEESPVKRQEKDTKQFLPKLAANMLSELISQSQTAPEVLSLCDCNLLADLDSETGISLNVLAFANGLRQNTTLKFLDLRSTNLNDWAIVQICRALEEHPSICTILLGRNDFAVDTIAGKALKDLVTVNKNITGIDLHDTKLSAVMVTTIEAQVTANTKGLAIADLFI